MQQRRESVQVCAANEKTSPYGHHGKDSTAAILKLVLMGLFTLLTFAAIQIMSPNQAFADPHPITETLDFVTDSSARGDLETEGYNWDGAGVLTLSGLALEVIDSDGIILPAGSRVNVVGASSITVTSVNKENNGILVKEEDAGNLTIAGGEKLSIVARNQEGSKASANGIVVSQGTLILSNCKVDSLGTESALFGFTGIEIDSSSISAKAKIGGGGCWAIYAYAGDINIRTSAVSTSVGGGIFNSNMLDEQYALFTAGGSINLIQSEISFDTTESKVEGNGIGALSGNLTIEGGSVQGTVNEFGSGIFMQIEDLEDPYGKVFITQGAFIAIEGFSGVSGPLGVDIKSSTIQIKSQGNAIIAGSGPMSIDSSKILVFQEGSPGGSRALQSAEDMTISNSLVEVYANKDVSCRGIMLKGDKPKLIIENNSTVISEGTEAAIVVWHDNDEASDSDSYILLGNGQKVLEGGRVAYLWTPEEEAAGSSYWSYSLGGSLSRDEEELLQGASKRVVIDYATDPVDPVDPVNPVKPGNSTIPKVGDTTSLIFAQSVVAFLIAGIVVIIAWKRFRVFRLLKLGAKEDSPS